MSNRSGRDMGILESKALVAYILISCALTGLGLWKLWELVNQLWRMF